MSDRYQFLKTHTDAFGKTFKAGCVARMSGGDAQPLIEDSVIKSVADYTPQRQNVLASGGCTQLSPSQVAQIETATFELEKAIPKQAIDSVTKTNKK